MSYTTFTTAFSRTIYPAGERHVRANNLESLRTVTTIEARVRTFSDLCEIVVADRILRRNNIRVEWFLPYFPFARHDRRIDAADGLELELALELIAEIDVIVADPHSEMTAVLTHIPQEATVDVMRSEGAFDSDPIVVIPDAGAAKKTYDWLGTAESIQALKKRNPWDGGLSNFEVIADDLARRPCIVVDDICDGGGTFLGLAERLRADHNAGPLTLVITHGLFTKGLEKLTDIFDRIYTFAATDETALSNTAGLTQVPFQVLYEKGTRR